MAPEVPATIARFRAAWDHEVGPAARRALVALGLAVIFIVAHVARLGTPLARGGAAASVLLLAVALAVRAFLARRRAGAAPGVVRRPGVPPAPPLGAAPLRAFGLAGRAASDARVGSPALAQLHLARLLRRAPVDRMTERAGRVARTWSSFGLLAAVLTLGAAVAEPFRVIEGLDVLAARDGEAPLQIVWLDEVELIAKAPEYLHLGEQPVAPFRPASLPRGTTITMRGRAVHPGRALVLTDGSAEVPFLDDGSGLLVAHWTLGDSTQLAVAARFGAVRVRQPDEQAVVSIPDLAPVVTVEGAPRTVRILDEPQIPIRFEVTDDHGLREVDLVLRAGTREERRVLSRPDADAKSDRGGYQIVASDPFFKKTYAPVEVTVEARDNDPVSGPKWGKSAAIVIVLPQVGEPEAVRYEALLGARDAVTDLLAGRLEPYKAKPGKERALHLERETAEQVTAVAAVDAALRGTYGGLTVKGRVVSLARGQLRRLQRALAAEEKLPGAAAHAKLVTETEEVLLAFDAGVRGLGFRDTRAVAKRLADVADEAAAGASLARVSDERPRGVARLEAAFGVLDGGGKQMLRLGDLGLDLGEIVANDLRRIARAQKAEDWIHAELAARDLAARLRRPDPSFGGGGKGGVESGGRPGPDEGEPSEADRQMAAGEQELEDLARDHAGKISEVESALEKAASAEEMQALREEAKEHAQAIREAVKQLPPSAGEPGSAESAAARARESAESMAGALERGQPRDAVSSGKDAVKGLGEAERLGDKSGFFPDERAAREAGKARPALERELAWAEEALERMQKSASDRARADLERSGKDEDRLAERAKRLQDKGQDGEGALPQETLDRLGDAEEAMRRARQALEQAQGEEGLKHQNDAQRLLEMALGERGEEGHGERESLDAKEMARKADIPGKEKHKGPEEFRRRVIKGLGGSADPLLKEAVKRYAEGLLK